MSTTQRKPLSRSFTEFSQKPGIYADRPKDEPREFELAGLGGHRKPWMLSSTRGDAELATVTVRAWESRGWVERIYRLLDRDSDRMLSGYIITDLGERTIRTTLEESAE